VIWGFVILGVVVSVPALEGLARGLIGRGRRTWRLETLVLLLVVGAWFAGHRTFTGWATLITAAILEAGILRSGRGAAGEQEVDLLPDDKPLVTRGGEPAHLSGAVHSAPLPTGPTAAPLPPDSRGGATAATTKPLDSVPSPSEPPRAEAESRTDKEAEPAETPPPVETPTRAYSTCALLASACEVSAEVFFASLRRGGLREAELLPSPDGGRTIRIRAGGIALELTSEAKKAAQAEISYAASQSWDWPEAAAVVGKHAAYVAVTTRSPESAPRGEIVHLHCRAQAALAEFAPVLAVLWPGAGRLMPASSPTAPTTDDSPESAPTTLCVNFRMFTPPEGEAGPFVSDSVGLHAFGLPDVQICGAREPDDAVSAVLYQIAERIFAEGCEIKDEDVLDLGELSSWRASRGRSRFEPDRDVIELTAAKNEPSPEPPGNDKPEAA
jgi:hypothetical protein